MPVDSIGPCLISANPSLPIIDTLSILSIPVDFVRTMCSVFKSSCAYNKQGANIDRADEPLQLDTGNAIMLIVLQLDWFNATNATEQVGAGNCAHKHRGRLVEDLP